MNGNRWSKLSAVLLLVGAIAVSEATAQPASSWTPTRINKVVELWEAEQPVYYQQISDYGYDECQAMAGTTADYISINMEHSYVDVKLLRDCMRGLVDSGRAWTPDRGATLQHCAGWLAGLLSKQAGGRGRGRNRRRRGSPGRAFRVATQPVRKV